MSVGFRIPGMCMCRLASMCECPVYTVQVLRVSFVRMYHISHRAHHINIIISIIVT